MPMLTMPGGWFAWAGRRSSTDTRGVRAGDGILDWGADLLIVRDDGSYPLALDQDREDDTDETSRAARSQSGGGVCLRSDARWCQE